MKSDFIRVFPDGDGINEALTYTEKIAAFKKLSHKEALHLRLLTEEMMGLLRGLTGETEAEFYIEDDGGDFRLHLITETDMDGEKRKKLLGTSTSGRNEAAKGVMGKLRDLFSQAFEPLGDDLPAYYSGGWINMDTDPMGIDFSLYDSAWSFNRYKETVGEGTEEWDELEKSIVANLADEIRIGIRGRRVEMVIFKNFNKEK